MLPELSSFYRQTVTVEPRSTLDAYGQPTYGAAVTHRVRLSGKRRKVTNDRGNEVLASHTVYFAAAPAIGAHDRITLSTGDVNSTETGVRQPPVVAVGRYPDDLGRVAVTVFLA